MFGADVIPGCRSDHLVVTLGIRLTPQKRGKELYKMYESLLTDSKYQDRIRQTIKESVATYALPVAIYTKIHIRKKTEDVSLTIHWFAS